MSLSHQRLMALLVIIVLSSGISMIHAHQDPCDRLHSCPSDHCTYVCGDTGRCDQSPDNHVCLEGKPRLAASPTPAPVTPTPTSSQSSTAYGATKCFTPAANCTELVVQALG